MDLHEYQTKELFVCYGLPIPRGYVCSTSQEAEEATAKIGKNGPWVIKCQVHAGGRGKAGGVKIINSIHEVRTFADYWLGNRLITYQTDACGQLVNKLLVEARTNVAHELYLSVSVDRDSCRVVFIASAEGGIEIETAITKAPHLINTVTIDPLVGAMPYQGRELAFKLGLTGEQIRQFVNIFMGLANMFFKLDSTLIEINPLAITTQGNLICLDGKVSIDDNALFRQPSLQKMRDRSQEDCRESQADMFGLNYVALSGNIGCMVNGAGLAMSTMDIIKLYGGEPANFLDVGGDTTQERVSAAFKIIVSDKKVKAILINIFGGIVRCDLVVDGLIEAIRSSEINIPVVVRLEGNNALFGREKLVNSGLNIIISSNIANAAQQVIAKAKEA